MNFGGSSTTTSHCLAVLLHLPRVGEGVGVDELEADLVEVGVAPGLLDRGLVQVHPGDIGRAAQHLGAEREAACVTAKVEHAGPRVNRARALRFSRWSQKNPVLWPSAKSTS